MPQHYNNSLRHITAHPKVFPFAHNHNSSRVRLRIYLRITTIPCVWYEKVIASPYKVILCWLESCLARSLQAHSLRQQLAVHSMNSWQRDIITFMANGIAWVKSHKCKENGFDLHENEAVGRTHFHGFAQRLKLVHTDAIRLWVKKKPSQWFSCIFVAVLKLWNKFCGIFRRHSMRSPFQSFNSALLT